MKTCKRYLASLLSLALLLGGCAKGDGVTAAGGTKATGTTAVGALNQVATGKATFTIVIPPAATIGNLQAKFISSNTKSITVAVNSGTPVEVDVSSCAVAGTTPSAAGTTCSIGVTAPVGSNAFAAMLWGATGGSGSVLAQSTGTFTVTINAVNNVSMTLAGVIGSIGLSAQTTTPGIGVAHSIPLTVTALDASGATIIGPYDQPIALTTAAGIVTIAGTGAGGYSGDGGAATAATLFNPGSVAVDGGGNVYVADTPNNRIRKVAASTGIITTIAGSTAGYSGDGGLATAAQLDHPSGVAVDGSGNVYIADSPCNCIRKVTASTGIITTIAGIPTTGYSGDGGLATAAQLDDPLGVAVDGSGNVYIADNVNHRIRKVTASTGIITTIAGVGTAGYSGDGGLATAAKLDHPYKVAVDGGGNVYVADNGNHRIRKVAASTGIITTIAGIGTAGYSDGGGLATAAQLDYPSGVAVDGSGNVLIADYSNQRVRKVTASTGIITTIAGIGTAGYSDGGGLATAAMLFGPIDVAVDGSGNAFIADYSNNRIRKVILTSGLTLPVTSLANSSTSATVNYDGSNSGGGPVCAAAPTEAPAPTQVCITITPALAVNNVAVSPTSASLASGTNTQLTATVNLSDGTTESAASWSSSNTNVATVNQSGVVTGVTSGTATITATSTRDLSKSASASVTITGASGQVTTDPTSLTLTQAGQQLTFTASQSGFSGPFTVSNCLLGDNSVAANVTGTSPTFTVTAVKAGTCTITVTGAGGSTGTLAASISTIHVSLN